MTQAMRVTAYNQEKGESTALFSSSLSIRVREMATEKDELLGGRPQKMMHAKKMGAEQCGKAFALCSHNTRMHELGDLFAAQCSASGLLSVAL